MPGPEVDTEKSGSDDEYYRCRTCGEWFPKQDAVKEVYCSNICATRYTGCKNCGKYFVRIRKTDDYFCSDACREDYSEKIKEIENNDQNRSELV